MKWGYASRPVTFAGGRGLICPAFGRMKWIFSMGWQNSWNQLRGLRQMVLAGEMPWSCWGGTKQCWDAAEGEEPSGDGQQMVQKMGNIVYPILPPTAWAPNSFWCHCSPYPAFFCAWLGMLGFVSVGYTPQTTDTCVCCRHVKNVGLTRQRHSVMLAFTWSNHRLPSPTRSNLSLRLSFCLSVRAKRGIWSKRVLIKKIGIFSSSVRWRNSMIIH